MSSITVAELRSICRKNRIPYSGKRKAELLRTCYGRGVMPQPRQKTSVQPQLSSLQSKSKCFKGKILPNVNVNFSDSLKNQTVLKLAEYIRDGKDIPFELQIKFINLSDHNKLYVADIVLTSNNPRNYAGLFSTSTWKYIKNNPHGHFPEDGVSSTRYGSDPKMFADCKWVR